MLSGGRNDGRHDADITIREDIAYISYKMMVNREVREVSFQLDAEYHSLLAPVYGFGVQVKKHF